MRAEGASGRDVGGGDIASIGRRIAGGDFGEVGRYLPVDRLADQKRDRRGPAVVGAAGSHRP